MTWHPVQVVPGRNSPPMDTSRSRQRRTSPWFALPLFAAVGAAGDARIRYEQARLAFERGELTEAAAGFALVDASDDTARAYARFGLATTMVQQVIEGSTESPNGTLREAISLYRGVLDDPRWTTLHPLARHNLEVAKRHWGEGLTKAVPADGSGEASQSADLPPDLPSKSQPSAKKPSPTDNAIDRPGESTSPRPGIGFIDPGPLTVEEAGRRLESAVSRISRDQSRAAPSPAPRQRTGPNDF